MDKVRNKYKKLIGKEAPENMSKVMLEKYIAWNKQVNSNELKELISLLKSSTIVSTVKSGTKLVREY